MVIGAVSRTCCHPAGSTVWVVEESKTPMSEEQVPDEASDRSHELAGAVVQRVFYVINSGPYGSSPEFSTRDQVVAYARERSAAGDFGSIVPEDVRVEVRAEYRLRSGRTTEQTIESFIVTG